MGGRSGAFARLLIKLDCGPWLTAQIMKVKLKSEDFSTEGITNCPVHRLTVWGAGWGRRGWRRVDRLGLTTAKWVIECLSLWLDCEVVLGQWRTQEASQNVCHSCILFTAPSLPIKCFTIPPCPPPQFANNLNLSFQKSLNNNLQYQAPNKSRKCLSLKSSKVMNKPPKFNNSPQKYTKILRWDTS